VAKGALEALCGKQFAWTLSPKGRNSFFLSQRAGTDNGSRVEAITWLGHSPDPDFAAISQLLPKSGDFFLLYWPKLSFFAQNQDQDAPNMKIPDHETHSLESRNLGHLNLDLRRSRILSIFENSERSDSLEPQGLFAAGSACELSSSNSADANGNRAASGATNHRPDGGMTKRRTIIHNRATAFLWLQSEFKAHSQWLSSQVSTICRVFSSLCRFFPYWEIPLQLSLQLFNLRTRLITFVFSPEERSLLHLPP
jgi:hypothetical protein